MKIPYLRTTTETETKGSKKVPYLGPRTSKTIRYSAARTYIARIWEYPFPPASLTLGLKITQPFPQKSRGCALKLTNLWNTSLLFDLNNKNINGSFAFSPGQIYIL